MTTESVRAASAGRLAGEYLSAGLVMLGIVVALLI